MSLDAALTTAGAAGLNGLTLYRTQGGGWQASSRWGGNTGWHVHIAGEPAAAIRRAVAIDGRNSPSSSADPAGVFE